MNKFELLNNDLGLDNKYENVIDYIHEQNPSNETTEWTQRKTMRDSFWQSRVMQTFYMGNSSGNFTWIGPDKVIVRMAYDSSENYSYCRYENKGKMYYAFITNVRVIANGYTEDEIGQQSLPTVEFTLETDVWTTYVLGGSKKYSFRKSFIERQHVNRWTWDSVNSKLKPIFSLTKENINYGEDYHTDNLQLTPFAKDQSASQYNLSWLYIIAKEQLDSSSTYTDTTIDGKSGTPYVPVDTGVFVYCLPTHNIDYGTNSITYGGESLANALFVVSHFRTDTRVLSIEYSKIAPCKFTMSTSNVMAIDIEDGDLVNLECTSQDNKTSRMLRIISRRKPLEVVCDNNFNNLSSLYLSSKPDPSNVKDNQYESKLKCYPYNFQKIAFGEMELTIKNELLTENTKPIAIKGISVESTNALTISGLANNGATELIKYDPENTITQQQPYFLELRTDAWNEYITANRYQRQSGYANARIKEAAGILGSTAGALITGNPALMFGAVGSFVSTEIQIASLRAKERDIKNQPDDIRQFTGDLSIANVSKHNFAKRINFDLLPYWKDYVSECFYMTGYNINNYGIPNLESRYYFNFIKIVDPNIVVECNQEALNKIKEIFRRGVRVWHYRNSMNDTTRKFLFLSQENENAEMDFVTE